MRTIKALVTVGVLAAATAVAVAAATSFPLPYTAVPTATDRNASATIGAYNVDRPMFEQRGELETGGRELTFVVLLAAGADYRLAARCGTNCVNLNLSIRDARGREVAADRTGSNVPVIDFNAPHAGAYTVTLDIASCQTPRCSVEVAVLSRGTPADA